MLSFVTSAVSNEEADAYATARGWTDWSGLAADKTSAIRRSQDFIASSYNHRWATEWLNEEAPDEVKYAIIEGARRELVSPGSLSPDVTPGKVKTRVRVEGAVDVTYAAGSGTASAQRPDIPIIDNLLAPYLIQSFGATVDLLRV